MEDLETAFNKVEALLIDTARKLALLSNNPRAIFAGLSSEKNFSPDTYRPALQLLIILALFGFVLISFWGLLLRVSL